MSFESIEVSIHELERIFKRVTRWSENCRYMISIDENGSEGIEYARSKIASTGSVDKLERYFTLTGIIFCRDQYYWLMSQVMELKRKYWNDGFWVDKTGLRRRVVFHSHDIRKHTGPFSLLNSVDHDAFLVDLTNLITALRGRSCVISITIDKQVGIKNYGSRMYNSYNLAVSLLLERYCFFLNRRSKRDNIEYKGMVVFESRGRDADDRVRSAIRHMISLGNNHNENKLFFDRIESVGFLRKYTDDYQKSHFTLELADIVSYPIYQHVRDGVRSVPFDVIEPLFDCYPTYRNNGLKVFP